MYCKIRIFVFICVFIYTEAVISTSKTPIIASKKQKYPLYQSYNAKRNDVARETNEDYITSYDSEYDARGKFQSGSNYEDQSIYPNPENLFNGKEMSTERSVDILIEPELPVNSLADADLKDHNLIDSLTYVYGFTSSSNNKTEWLLLMYVSRALGVVALACSAIFLFSSDKCKVYRNRSILFPESVNLLCCFGIVDFLYMEAVWGTKSSLRCEMVALLLHYWHAVCSAWVLLICLAVMNHARGRDPLAINLVYLLAYGAPGVYVLFYYALSIEHYETRRYCWMSVENGMLMGVLAPGTMFILGTTLAVVRGLRDVHEKRAKLVTDRIQQIIDSHVYRGMAIHAAPPLPQPEEASAAAMTVSAANPMTEPSSGGTNVDRSTNTEIQMCDGDQYCSCDVDYCNCDDMCEECEMCEDNCENVEDIGNIANQMDKENHMQANEMAEEYLKFQSVKLGLIDLSLDNLSWQSSSCNDLIELKKSLNFCLILQPFHIIVWFMGVIAIENANSWFAPSVFLILCVTMHLYMAYNVCTCQPLIGRKMLDDPLDQVVSEINQPIHISRTTDSIPLLDCMGSPPPPARDSISTISI